jgi:hypothetical protein
MKNPFNIMESYFFKSKYSENLPGILVYSQSGERSSILKKNGGFHA